MKIESLDAVKDARNKSKDIHLPSIDISFCSNRILSGASLTLAHGCRYGFIGRNGVGKSTLLRHIAMRDVPILAHITILFVEQEVTGQSSATTQLPSTQSSKPTSGANQLLREEASLNARLATLNTDASKATDNACDELNSQLSDVHARLADMDPASDPARAAALLAGLAFSEADQQRPTKSWPAGWRMRLALARVLFVKPALLLLGGRAITLTLCVVALNALAWLENYLQTWEGTLLVISHDRAFLDAVATDIIHQHSGRLDYCKGCGAPTPISGRERSLTWLSDVTFGYDPATPILNKIPIDVGLDSRIAVMGNNGAGKSTLIKLLTGDLSLLAGQLNRNGRLRVGCFAQHHVETLIPTIYPVQFLVSKSPGKTEQEYRSHLGNFQIGGMTGMQLIGTSRREDSRVALAVLSMLRSHILLFNEPTNHLDLESLDARMKAPNEWNCSVIIISYDECIITHVANELWVCSDRTVSNSHGDVQVHT
ncbi:unnamed protein product [Peniophora sp. CBMAI 1063]|nr:unnamed protein product [Peniophora sp. CBMAI 1063]